MQHEPPAGAELHYPRGRPVSRDANLLTPVWTPGPRVGWCALPAESLALGADGEDEGAEAAAPDLGNEMRHGHEPRYSRFRQNSPFQEIP
jgi:hypothetical protein